MTDEQIAQRNRENSAHSTGPRTEAGRQRSSLNAYRNGLNGQIVCSTPEELSAFKLFCSEIREELAPVGPIERFLAKSVSENMYRLERARSVENGIWADGFREHVDEIESGHPEVDTALSASRTFLEHAHEISLISTYEGRLRRAVEKDEARLQARQEARKAKHEHAVEQAEILVEHAESKGEVYEPGEDFTPAADHGGFVFSTPEIARRRDRQARFRAAQTHHFDVRHGRHKTPKAA
jgi:hypothetical protein